MKTRFLALTGLLTAFVSCYNESDLFPAFDDDCNWETTLNDIISDNEELFDVSGFKIVDMKYLDDIVLDSTFFYDEKNGYFPVYSKTDSALKVLSYNEIEESKDANDTRFLKIRNKINNLISNQDDYYCVQLTWQYGDDRFNTLSLFNKKTGELEYDNMLFNMETISKYSYEGLSKILTRYETDNYVLSRSVYVQYRSGDTLIASAGLNWNVFGDWNISYNVFPDETNTYLYYVYHFTFSFDHIDVYPTSYIRPSCGGDTFIRYLPGGYNHGPKYSLYYALWAGPKGNFYDVGFSFAENDLVFYHRFDKGAGEFCLYEETPYRPDSVVVVSSN